jgi:hypothetical protein
MSRWRQRVRLEDGLKLDLNFLTRDCLARPGKKCYATITWNGEPGQLTADMTGVQQGWLRLELGPLDQWIDLEPVPRHFGGRQWYFVCPTTGRRASVLWKPPGASRFASRQAWGRQVAYSSQFQPAYVRTDSRFQELVCRLGGSDFRSEDGSIPPKPKGMHWRTYEAELDRCEALRIKSNFYWAGFIGKLGT